MNKENSSFNVLFLVYVETLLYIVHVDDIDIPLSNDIQEETYDGGDEQGSISLHPLARRLSKRTTASFNERHQRTTNQPERIPIYTRPSFSFSNPLRRLNSLYRSIESKTNENDLIFVVKVY